MNGYPWTNLIDDNPNTFENTTNGGQIYVDLGSGKPLDRVTLINRAGQLSSRLIGTVLTVETASKRVLFSHTFTTGEATYDFSIP